MDINASRGMQAGTSAEKVRQVAAWRQSPLFSPLERDALEYAERMSGAGARVDDELVGRLRAQLTEAQLVELTAAVALEHFRSRLNVALGVAAQGFCVLP
jgi:alkylhydroperoxidase family enzyme